MEDFNDMISNGNLIDIGFTGNNFTWHRGHLWQRLDRVLFNDDWLNVFHLTKVEHLSRTLSDHSPILINIKNDCTAPISHFRFQNMWLLHPTFLDVVKVNWEAPVFPDDTISGMHRLWLKLKRLKIVLKCWNHNVFKNLFANISSVESKVNSLDSLFQSDPTEVNFALLNEAKVDLCMFQDQEEFWKQKAAVKHLVDGDRNTKYFHALVKKRRSSNFIHKIAKEDGTMSEDYGEIFSLAVNFFQSDFFKGSVIPKFFSSTFVVLLPKNNSINTWNDFRPISLCTVFYKVLSKILMNRLTVLLPKLISPYQMGFVKGKAISDNILLAQEFCNDDVKCRGGNMIMKLDILKAYDNIN
ncbi:hypothetical protein MA16_Dca000929 [Dendrobium catenatum]|uniref:Reverse transcriptase domain-containing protein n=1 Tax=Dendrobium catenatum TaxID=906689 RepID=A0A2I0WVC0_9ASPA|nr:hypothetical protein MA16_Dca000929 [Dendrobium catenatum]